ncbi:cobalamin-binding protein [Paraglaciecola sp. L3A3]|uniref:cobalamin-binding protein n=1 Tax=Paraglaciecola sp. L3A3 TaxID=2686358 RepID=UPI001E4CEDCD|nr:cobalamin-binding protein [Paraglaciecola sp. L3A3]
MFKLFTCLASLHFAAYSFAATELSNQQKQQLKIIALAPHIVESLYEIGAGEQIIGTSSHADYPEAAKDILRVGNYASLQLEKILQLKPDIILAWQTGNPMSDLARLEKYDFKIVYSKPLKLEDVASEMIMLGELTGRQEKAKQMATKYLNKLNQLTQEYADTPPVIVFNELWSRPLRTVAGQSWPQQQIDLCGGKNPFADVPEDYPAIGLEQVLVSEPQVILQPSQHGEESPDRIKWQQWPHLPAAKNDFIFLLDADKVHRMTSRMLEEVEVMCQKIHQARLFYQHND